jgi:hypothetical protein
MRVIHAGGEVLDCDAWEAAIMVLPDAEVRPLVSRLEADEQGRLAWAGSQLGLEGLAPYCVSRGLFRHVRALEYRAVGGVGLAHRPRAFRREVLEKLEQADRVSVRDRRTLEYLRASGVIATLAPDPALSLLPRFGPRIERHACVNEVAAVRAEFPAGYLAVQFSADYGDDATLAALASQLDRIQAETGWGLVFFRAGAAPWHDRLSVYQRLTGFLPMRQVVQFQSLDLWDICALIAHSRAFCGSSLHGRLLAQIHGLPGVSLVREAGRVAKVAAYWETWYPQYLDSLTTVHAAAASLLKQLGQ